MRTVDIIRHLPSALGLVLATAAFAPAQDSPWGFATHIVMTGASDEAKSDPEGYAVYSAFTLDAAVRRRLSSRFALETNVRTESREVTVLQGGSETPIGSIEALPVSLVLQYRPEIGDRVRPYVGAGPILTLVWEKAGALDSTDLSPYFAPVVQLGADVRLSPRVFLNLDLKWNPWRTDIDEAGEPIAHLQIDPLALGIGVGFRF